MKSNNQNSNNNNTTNSNLNSGAVRAEYMYSSFIPLDPVRATCLRYAKTFQKVEHATGNRAFFQFDGEGVTLRAQDKNALGLAQKQFTLMSKANMIEILPTPGFGEEDLKQLMLKEIRSQMKYSKVFVQLVSMEAFRIMAQQLKGFGYDEPLRLWEKTSKLHKRFAFLVCHEAQFQAVRQEIVKLLKNVPKEQKTQNLGVKQAVQSSLEGTSMRNSQTQQQQQLYSPWVSMQYVKKEDNLNSSNNTKQINEDKKNFSLEQSQDSKIQFVKKGKVEKMNLTEVNPLTQGGNECNFEKVEEQNKIEETKELSLFSDGIFKCNQAQDMKSISQMQEDSQEKPDESRILEQLENQNQVNCLPNSNNEDSEPLSLKKELYEVNEDDNIQTISHEIHEKLEELQRKHKTSGSKGNLLIVPESHQLEAEYSTRDDEEQDELEDRDGNEEIIPESRQKFLQILTSFEHQHQGENEILSRFQSLTEEQKQRNFFDLLAAQDSLLASINEIHEKKTATSTTANNAERNLPFNNSSTDIDQQSQQYGHLSSPPSRSLRSSVSGSIMSFSLNNHNSDVHEILRRDRITMDSLPRMVVVVSGCVGESEWVLKELSEVRWEAVVIDACIFAWLFHSNRVKHSDKRIRVVREDRHLAVVEGLPRDVIAVIASTKDLVLNTQQDSLKTAAKWIDEEVLESLKHCNNIQGQVQQQQQQLNSEQQSQQQSSGLNSLIESSSTPRVPSTNSATPGIFAELMSFEDLKGQSRKFKNKALQRVCAQTYRALLGSKDKQTGCLLIHNQKFVIRANSPLRSLMPSQSPLANNRDMFINSERMAQSNHMQLACGQQQQLQQQQQPQQIQQQQSGFKKQPPQRNPSNNSRTSSNSSSLWASQSSGGSSFLSNSKLSQLQQQRLMASCFSKKNGCKEIMRSLRSFLRLRYLQLAGCVGQTNGKGNEEQEMTVAQRGEEEMAVARALSLYTQMIPFDLSAIIRVSSLTDEEDSDEEDTQSLNHAQTYIVTYKSQTFCLKEYREISAAKLNKAICAYKEHELAENTQLLHIYSILIIPCNSGNTGGCNDNSSQIISASQKQLNALHSDESAFKSSSSSSSSSAMNFSMYSLSDLKYMNLRQALEGRYIDNDQKSLQVCYSLVSALQNIHSKLQDGSPMFHGNLKPNNVLLDIGLSVTLSDLNPDPVQSKGTCAYFAPEVQQRKQRPDLASDMFSLGLLLYEIVHRHSLAKLDRKKLKKLSYEYFPKTLQPLKSLIQKCLLKDPLTRPSAKNILMEIAVLKEAI